VVEPYSVVNETSMLPDDRWLVPWNISANLWPIIGYWCDCD